MDIQKFVLMGLKREVNQLIEPDMTNAIEIGCGNNPTPGARGYDFPQYDFSYMSLPDADNSVTAIFAFHVLEHLTGQQAINILREFQRVLVPGGTATILVPYFKSQLAFQDLDHKSFFTEETWKTLFRNPYYGKNREEPWKLDVHFNLIAGVVERNLSLFTQLVRTE